LIAKGVLEMPTLRLKNLHCFETEDNWGADHAYIVANGSHVWGPTKINDNQWREVNVDFPFASNVNLELYEKDDADPDDYLGTWVVRDVEQNHGELRAFLNADDAHYELFYEVV
jgi:hypothetical protein